MWASKHGEDLSTQKPQETQEKYVYDVVDQSDALHDAMTKMARYVLRQDR